MKDAIANEEHSDTTAFQSLPNPLTEQLKISEASISHDHRKNMKNKTSM
jgi:hypothetical protein